MLYLVSLTQFCLCRKNYSIRVRDYILYREQLYELEQMAVHSDLHSPSAVLEPTGAVYNADVSEKLQRNSH